MSLEREGQVEIRRDEEGERDKHWVKGNTNLDRVNQNGSDGRERLTNTDETERERESTTGS